MTKFEKDKIVLAAGGPQRINIGPVNHLPLSLLSLAAWIREKGDYSQKIKILDTQIRKPVFQDFADAAVVGISAMTGLQVKYGLEVAALARKSNPDALIVWGGIHPSLLPEQTLMHPLVDLVVTGEGEQTFLEVVEAVFNKHELAGIPGTCVQKDSGELVFGQKRPFLDLDKIPVPAYDLIDMKNYHGIEYQFDYQSSRGCPFKCGFCYNITFCGSRWRKKSPEKVIKELSYLYDKYKILNFAFVDDEFFIDIKRAEAIFDGILESKKEFNIIASCRLDIIRRFSPSVMSKMKQSGVTQMFFGAESGSDKILRAVQKKITTEDIAQGSKITAEQGIRPILSFMSGFPGETLDDFEHTIDMILKLWEIHPLITVNGIFPFNPYPGTILYQKALELGLKPPGSLKEWGNWTFQYEPDSPWLDPVMKQWMEIAFYMVRFRYYIARYEDRYKGKFLIQLLLKTVAWPISAWINIRMKKRMFGKAWEWKIFALIMQKTFGYL
ncbi:MAG: B12-binding domain-containing radical SAM protein [Desulfobacterales bacterium]|nr:B12-binding domain-containing radical SAM protein [Desulfobacterales bacterium]